MSNAILKTEIPHEVEIELDGRDVAELFWELSEDEQADFFNTLGCKDVALYVNQLQMVTDSRRLDLQGRDAMARIGEYASEDMVML